jgi:hypothetical protein
VVKPIAMRERWLLANEATKGERRTRTQSTVRSTAPPGVERSVPGPPLMEPVGQQTVATQPRGVRGWHGVRAVVAWVAWLWVWGTGCWQRLRIWWTPRRVGAVATAAAPAGARVELLRVLAAAAAGTPAVDTAAAVVVGAAAAAAAAQMRATRALRTDAGARGALRQVTAFVQANPALAVGVERVSDRVWDAVMEAFLTAKADPPTGHAWRRPSEWRSGGTPKGASGATDDAVNALRRLGYIGGVLVRVGVARRALGCTDKEDVVHAPPIFAWRVCAGVRDTAAATVWDRCARALVALACLSAGRRGTATKLLLEQVTLTDDPDVVLLTARQRQKTQHERATRRPRRTAQPVAIEHWLVRVAVVPWVRWLRDGGAAGTQYLFPSLVRRQVARAVTVNGRLVEGGLWLEPMRPWSARAIAAALALVLGATGEAFHGLRAGNNIELRRHRDKAAGGGAVEDVTRRALHGRSVRDLIGSEVAYSETFLEDFRAATRVLGGLRIERVAGGLCTTGRSASRGEHIDWQRCAAVVVPEADLVLAPSEGDSSGEEEDEDAVGDGTSFSGSVDCGRCGRHLFRRDHGFMCDSLGCTWGVCPPCHPAGTRGALLCPVHLA